MHAHAASAGGTAAAGAAGIAAALGEAARHRQQQPPPAASWPNCSKPLLTSWASVPARDLLDDRPAVVLLRCCCGAAAGSAGSAACWAAVAAVRRRWCGDALGREAPAGADEAEQIVWVGEGASSGVALGRLVAGADGEAGGGRHLQRRKARAHVIFASALARGAASL
jgi:hypothetical protein